MPSKMTKTLRKKMKKIMTRTNRKAGLFRKKKEQFLVNPVLEDSMKVQAMIMKQRKKNKFLVFPELE